MNKKILLIVLAVFAVLILLIVFWTVRRKPGPHLAPASLSSVSASSLLAQAKALEAKEKWIEAKNIYQKLIGEFVGSNEVMSWQKRIEEINIRMLFSPLATPESRVYEIKPGDTLVKIAKEFKTTPDLIMKSNNMPNDKLIPGRKVKVWSVPFAIHVDKSQNLLMLKANEEVLKTYVVSTGLNNSTPVGTFKITNKLQNPTWFKAGAVVPAGSPENILGTRWMGFDLAGYGIHGTTEPENLGRQVTQGCVRMRNAEVEELYTIVPVGTEVTVVD